MLVPVVLLANRLDLDLWEDEMFTLANYAGVSFHKIVTDYSAPNNHPLYSLVLRIFWLIADSEYVMRFPSFIASVATLALVFAIAQRASGLPAAVAATLGLGLNQMFLSHAVQLRGYPLNMFLMAALAWLAFRDKAYSGWRPALIALTGASFLYVMPSNVLSLPPLVAVAKLQAFRASRAEFTRALLAWGGAAALAVLFYLPIITQISQHAPAERAGGIGAVVANASAYFRAVGHDYVWIAPLLLLGIVAAVFRWRRGEPPRDRWLLAFLILAHIFPFLIAGMADMRLFVRNYCALLPLTAIAFGLALVNGLGFLRRLAAPKLNDHHLALAAAAIIAIVVGPQLTTFPARLDQERQNHFAQDGYYNYYAARYHPSAAVRAARELSVKAGPYRICYTKADHYNLVRYLLAEGLPVQSPGAPKQATLFILAPHLIDKPAIASHSNVPLTSLDNLTLIDDFGYYRLYRTSTSVLVNNN